MKLKQSFLKTGLSNFAWKHIFPFPGKVDLELIEVQTGTYLGEDDIVRFDDLYGRK